LPKFITSKNNFFFGKRKQHGIPLPVLHVCRRKELEEIKEWFKDCKISEEEETTDYSLERIKSLWSFLKSVVPSKKKLGENDTSSV